MGSKVLVRDIAASVNATDEDVQSLDLVWQRMIKLDHDGEYYIDESRKYYLLGALDAAADQRRAARIEAADTALLNAYTVLLTATPSSGNQGQEAWHKAMLAGVTQIRDALVELVDAKVDAKKMQPTVAAHIRADADELLHDAQHNAQRALRHIRILAASR